ncbi:uridine kinase family protein [Neobacillus sp. SM06]|uniref:uridine kinase family protein n=2 Tax=Neobacillus sp. SM06 TaxID=3422492 RepID=UPI003D271500
MSLDRLIEEVDKLSKKHTLLLIGIDGCGGAGKSTLARNLAKNFTNCTIVHMDDFYHPSEKIIKADPAVKPIGADFDWERLENQLLLPLTQGQNGSYQRYDWDTDKMAEWHTVPATGIVVIEGVYSTRKELFGFYDLTIWVNTPRETRLKRGLERDGEGARSMWEENWMVSEDLYVKKQQPDQRVNFIVDGTY